MCAFKQCQSGLRARAVFNRGLSGLALAGVVGTSVALAEAPAAGPEKSLDDLASLEEEMPNTTRTKRRIQKPLPFPGKYDEHQRECKGPNSHSAPLRFCILVFVFAVKLILPAFLDRGTYRGHLPRCSFGNELRPGAAP